MRTVSSIVSDRACTLASTATAEEARQTLRERSVHGLAVVDEHSRLVGIITATDLLAVDELPTDLADTMSTDVLTVSPNTSIVDAARTMRTHGIHHLVVVDAAGKVAGMLSSFDLLAAIAPDTPPAAATTPGEHSTPAAVGISSRSPRARRRASGNGGSDRLAITRCSCAGA